MNAAVRDAQDAASLLVDIADRLGIPVALEDVASLPALVRLIRSILEEVQARQLVLESFTTTTDAAVARVARQAGLQI